MPFTLTATVNPTLPGSVQLGVVGDPAVQSSIQRIDAHYAAQPVRNYDSSGSGIESVIDCEAPLGRPVHYLLLDYNGAVLASSAPVTCPPLASGRSLLRSVLKPSVVWLEVEPQDETGVEWPTSTAVHIIPDSPDPVVVGGTRQRHRGVISFLCRSIPEADQLVSIMRDGVPLLLRHDPCSQTQTRDMLFFAGDVSEVRWQRDGWRLVIADYVTTGFVPGVTEEPGSGWDFAALAASAPDFAALAGRYRDFASMALDIRLVAR